MKKSETTEGSTNSTETISYESMIGLEFNNDKTSESFSETLYRDVQTSMEYNFEASYDITCSE